MIIYDYNVSNGNNTIYISETMYEMSQHMNVFLHQLPQRTN